MRKIKGKLSNKQKRQIRESNHQPFIVKKENPNKHGADYRENTLKTSPYAVDQQKNVMQS